MTFPPLLIRVDDGPSVQRQGLVQTSWDLLYEKSRTAMVQAFLFFLCVVTKYEKYTSATTTTNNTNTYSNSISTMLNDSNLDVSLMSQNLTVSLFFVVVMAQKDDLHRMITICRKRRVTDGKRKRYANDYISMNGNDLIVKLLNSSTTNGYTESRYSFDHVYDESISNEQIYVDNILPYLQNCIENVQMIIDCYDGLVCSYDHSIDWRHPNRPKIHSVWFLILSIGSLYIDGQRDFISIL